jgi:hypothetical protein
VGWRDQTARNKGKGGRTTSIDDRDRWNVSERQSDRSRKNRGAAHSSKQGGGELVTGEKPGCRRSETLTLSSPVDLQ